MHSGVFLKRTLSTVILWGLAMLAFVFGPVGAVWIIALFAALTQFEFYSLLVKADFRPQRRLGVIFGILIILGAWYAPQFTDTHYRDAGDDIFTIAVICICLTVLIRPDFTEAKSNIMPTLLGLVMVPYMLHFYVKLIYQFNHTGEGVIGLLLTLWLIAVAKFTDVGGLILGMIFGRHKLARDISPGKTWEGAIGGILIASAVGGVLCYYFNQYFTMPTGFTVFKMCMIAVPVALISIASDLFESVIKRKAGVKDSGAMVPGIGGAFDLTDSLLLSAPCGYLFLKYFVL